MHLDGRSLLLLVVLTQISVLVAVQCPTGYERYKNRCYYFSATRANWQTAQNICRSRGGNLATINSPDEQQFLTNRSYGIAQNRKIDMFYIGVTDLGTEGKFRNVDKTPFKGKFVRGQPDNAGKNEHCGSLIRWAKFGLNDYKCTPNQNYICERNIYYLDPCDVANGWHLVSGRCYKFYSEAATWSQARAVCQAEAADLITINTANELQLVGENIECHNTVPVWLGYSDTDDTNTLKWVDGTTPAAAMLKWDKANGEPDAKNTKGMNCGLIIPNNRNLWQLSNCENSENQFLCEKTQGQCPLGWQTKGARCYKQMFSRYTWMGAINYCTDRGAAVVTMADIKRDSTIIPRLSIGFANRFWIPFSDRAKDGTFKYLNGGGVPTADLAAQKPNQAFECGIVTSSGPKTAQLTSCYEMNGFVCVATKGTVKSEPSVAPADGKKCYDGWTRFEDQCYQKVAASKTYAAAKADCVAKQATLLVIQNQRQLDYLAAGGLLSSTSWLGLDDLKSTGKFVWNDGKPVTEYKALNWGFGEPNNHKSNEHCVEILNIYGTKPAVWNDIDCTQIKPYVCQTGVVDGIAITTATPTRPWSTECGVGWIADHITGNCYFFSEELLSWNDADKACNKRSSGIMSFGSKAESSFIQGLLKADISGNVAFWTGGNDLDTEQGWMWSDGSPFNFINFSPGEPNSSGDEDCIEVVTSTGLWNDIGCSWKRPYICKKTAVFGTVAPGPTTPIPSVSTDCKTMELVSGDHWIPDSAITTSTVRDKDSGPENSRIDWTATDTKITIKTEDKYEYQPVSNLHLLGVTSILLTVQACNDAHISLQPAVANISSDAYEIVLGGWSNSQSAIRLQHQGSSDTKYSKSDLVNCNKPSPFWISWSNNMIQVGTGVSVSGSTMFMKLAVTDSKPISGIAVSTGWGSSGTWVVTNPHGTRKGAWSPRISIQAGVPIGAEQYVYSQWIQADFAKPALIRSISTKGSSTGAEYVTEYYVQYSYNDDKTWQYYREAGGATTKFFTANTDKDTPVVNTFATPFEAQYVRLVPRKFINYPSLRWAINGCPAPKYCIAEPLVTGDTYIADRYITSSSRSNSKSADARLAALPGATAPDGWIAATPNIAAHSLSNEWIQVYFGKEMVVNGVITKGHATQPYWVKTYQLQTRGYNEGFRWINYQQPYGTVKTFTGNTDQNTEVRNDLANPIVALYLRIYPRSFEKNIALRFDVVGCLSGCALTPLIEKISDSRLSVSSSLRDNTGPYKIRLDTTGWSSAWVPSVANTKQFFQVDFGVTERIYAITTQGRGDKAQWVKTYKLAYSRDGKRFYTYYYSGYKLTGNVDQNTKHKVFLPRVISAQAIKVYPLTWQDMPAMRLELYGCSGSNPKPVGCFVEGNSASTFSGPTSYFSYNSPSRCAERCFKDGYFYAGLSRSNCKCGNNAPIGGSSDRCDYRCSGDRSSYCGGYTSALVSIYETGLGPDDERCPEGYATYNEKCFKLSKEEQTWQGARDSCKADGGDLASIHNQGEQAYLQTQLSRLDKGVWIGLNDFNHQMFFTWTDKSKVTFTKWMHGEPNNYKGRNEDCVEAISESEVGDGFAKKGLQAANGLWQDAPCDTRRYSMCQHKKVKNENPPTQAPRVLGCPVGWLGYESSCYMMSEHYSTWSLASDTCSKEGGYLVRINDEYEQTFLTSQMFRRNVEVASYRNTLYWTDLRSKPATRQYVWSNDWDVIPYTHWAKGQPKNAANSPFINWSSWSSARSKCVAMNGVKEEHVGRWSTLSCGSGAFIMCEKARRGYSQPGLPTLAPQDINCPNGWIGIGPNCYQVNKRAHPVDRKTFSSAQGHCKAQGANLAYINNATENDALWRNHLMDPNDKQSYWIGLNERAGKQYNWISGDPFTYDNWGPNEPNDWDGKEMCVVMFSNDGTWNDEKCPLLHNWICSISRTDVKKLKTIRTTPEPTADAMLVCPDGDDWKGYNGHCYKLNSDLKTWREAENYCQQFNGHLASSQLPIENSFLRVIGKPLVTNTKDRTDYWQMAGQIGSQRTLMWIGLNEIDRSLGHRWSDSSPYKYSFWATGEPNDWRGGEYCVGMFVANGRWNDMHCSARLPSVCEKDPQHTDPPTTTPASVVPGYCEQGYVDFENDCYKVVSDQYLNQSTAESTCDTEGGHLAYIQNNREQTFLVSQLMAAKKSKVSLWIGLKHGADMGPLFSNGDIYTWTSNKDLSYTDWNVGEPNRFDNKEQCTEMLFKPAGRWNDLACDIAKGYVCRKPKSGLISVAPAVDTTGCPTDYIRWNDACYKYIDSQAAWNYIDGNTCAKDGAKLLSIQSPYEYSFIRTWLWKMGKARDIWIGLMSQANSNTFTWSNYWPVTVTYWASNEPTGTFASEEGCVTMDTGKGENEGRWKHTTCKDMYPAICKKPLTSVPIKPPASMVCKSAGGENWIANANGYCYLFNVDPRYSHDEAEAACRSAGADLASINSDEDTRFVSLYMEHMDVQVVKGGTKSVWIGLRKLDAGGYKWSDNQPVYYSNWADDEPSSDDEKCTEVWGDDAKWNDNDCNVKRGFICRIRQGDQPASFATPLNTEPTTMPFTTPRSNPCQLDGWKFFNGSCYLMVSEADKLLRWNQADDYCRAPGRSAHLASIHTEEENQWVVENVLPKRSETDAWIGLAELQRDNYFSWTDGSPVTFHKWGANQTDLNAGSMECSTIVITGSGTGPAGLWSIEYCFSKKAFICKIDASIEIAATVLTPYTDGSMCHFPFVYRGQEYDTCTTYGTAGAGNFQWCATTDHYDRDGKFAICDPFTCALGWTRHDRLCYYFSDSADKRTWLDSEARCEQMGGELGYIGDATAESFITDNIKEYFWIGLNDRILEGHYGWDHRPTMIMTRGFTNWGKNEPRSSFGTEDCVEILKEDYGDSRPGEWVMENCEQRRRYVCMKDATYTLGPKAPITTPKIPLNTSNGISIGPNTGGGDDVALSSTLPSIGNTDGQKGPVSADMSRLRSGEIAAIIIACLALVLAGVFIFLYVRRVRPTQSQALKGLGGGSADFTSAVYHRNDDAVQVGLENPNFSSD